MCVYVAMAAARREGPVSVFVPVYCIACKYAKVHLSPPASLLIASPRSFQSNRLRSSKGGKSPDIVVLSISNGLVKSLSSDGSLKFISDI